MPLSLTTMTNDKKKILITGVSRGIGRALVTDLVQRGHIVYGVSRNAQALERISNGALPMSGEFVPVLLDIGVAKSREFIERLNTERLDILINNAGYLINRPFESITSEELNEVYDINIKAPFLTMQSLMPLLKRSQAAHVVNIGSMGGVNGTAKFSGLSAYSSSKGALSILTECLAEEYKDSNIHFNCLALGSANTEMLKEAFPGYEAPISAEAMARYIADFALEQREVYNGKTLPVSSTTP